MKRYGLIGKSLTHSFSKKYFTEKFEKEAISDCQYDLFPLKSIEELPKILKDYPDLRGLNVTIPYKEVVIPYLDEVKDVADRIGAVNVIKIEDNKLIGYNSDYYGFKSSLLSFIPSNYKSKALILGSGGASKAIKVALSDLKIPFKTVSRSDQYDLSYEDLRRHPELIDTHQLIINCTPLGTFPSVEEKPDIPYKLLTHKHFLYDLVYNPKVTAFMKSGISANAKVLNGYPMLVEQAEISWRIWGDSL